SAGTSAPSGRSRPTSRRQARSRCASPPRARNAPPSNLSTATWTATARAGRASATESPAWAAGRSTFSGSWRCWRRRADRADYDSLDRLCDRRPSEEGRRSRLRDPELMSGEVDGGRHHLVGAIVNVLRPQLAEATESVAAALGPTRFDAEVRA